MPLTSKNIKSIQESLKHYNRLTASASYKKLSKSNQAETLLLAYLNIVSSALSSNCFNAKEGLAKDLMLEPKKLLKSELILNAAGEPVIYTDAHNHDCWKATSGFTVRIINTSTATRLADGTYKDEERIYDPATQTVYAPVKAGIRTWGVQDSSKHVYKLGNLFTSTTNKDRKLITKADRISTLCQHDGSYELDTKNQTKALDYMIILDCDNAARYKVVLEALKKSPFCPQMCIVKNKHSNREGSMHCIITVTSKLTSEQKDYITKSISKYLIEETDTITIDPKATKSIYIQNFMQQADNNHLTHNTYVKADFEAYKLSDLLSWCSQFDELYETEEELQVINLVTANRKLLDSNVTYSQHLKRFNASEYANIDLLSSVPYAWAECVPQGSRNATLYTECCQLINEYLGKYGIENLWDNEYAIVETVYSRTLEELCRYDNEDGQMTESFLKARIRGILKDFKRKNGKDNHSRLDSGIQRAVNIALQTGESKLFKLVGDDCNKAVFTYASTLTSNYTCTKLQKLEKERGRNTQQVESLITGLANIPESTQSEILAEFKQLWKLNAVDNETMQATFFMFRDDCTSNLNGNGGPKAFSFLATVAQAQLMLENVKYVAQFNPLECTDKDGLRAGKFADTINATITNYSKKERNVLAAINLTSFYATNDSFMQKRRVAETIVNIYTAILAEIQSYKDPMAEETIYRINSDGEVVADYALVRKLKVLDHVTSAMYYAQNTSTSVVRTLLAEMIAPFKSTNEDGGLYNNLDKLEPITIDRLNNTLRSQVEEGMVNLLVKSAIPSISQDAQVTSILFNKFNVIDESQDSETAGILSSNVIYTALMTMRQQCSGQKFREAVLTYAKSLTKIVKSAIQPVANQFFLECSDVDYTELKRMLKEMTRMIMKQLRDVVAIVLNTLKARINEPVEETFELKRAVRFFSQLKNYALAI